MATSTLPERTAGIAPPQPLEQRHYGDRLFKALLTVAALAVPVLLGFLVYELWMGSRLAIGRFGTAFVSGSTWDPVAEQFGAFPLIIGTLASSFLALLIAVPLSLGVAIFLTEFAPRRIRQPIAFLIELLAARKVGARKRRTRLRFTQRGIGLREVGIQGSMIEGEQQLAALDPLPDIDVQRRHAQATELHAQLHLLNGGHRARHRDAARHLASRGGRRADRKRTGCAGRRCSGAGRGGAIVLLLATGGEYQDCTCQQRVTDRQTHAELPEGTVAQFTPAV